MTALFSSRVAPRFLAAFLLLGVSLNVCAQTTVSDAWVRTTVPGQSSSGAFMHITASSDSALLSVSSPLAKDVQVHEMSMKDDIMRMGPVNSVPLPAGKTVSLDPEGYHVMLMGLTGQIKEGDQVPLTLTVESADGTRETLDITAPARSAAMHDHAAMH
jgi:copper(I)-binding protein